jgi:hypothetical protein
MKTPRDLLFARHQAAGPRLDAIRRDVMAAEFNHQDTKAQSWPVVFMSWCLGGFNRLWLELVWPCRRVWTGLAAVWVFLLIINVAQRDHSPVIIAQSQPTVAMLLAFRDQEKILNELLADHSQPTEADRPRNFAPKPRSEISGTVII